MAINQQTFPTDLILPGLVSWFNAQSAELRVIETNDVAFFRVRVVEDANGTPTMVIGDQAYEEPGSTYLYESTFVWKGDRGINLTATADSFFEISKFVAAESLNIIPFFGSVEIPEEIAEQLPFLKMGYARGYMYGDGSAYTIGIDGQGRPEVQTTNSYVDLNPGLTGIVEVTAGDMWVAARNAAGEIYVWGDNYSLIGGSATSTPVMLDTGYYTSTSVATAVGAFQDSLAILDDDGNVILLGDNTKTGGLGLPSNVKEIYTFWSNTGTSQQSALFAVHLDGTMSIYGTEYEAGNIDSYPQIVYQAPTVYVSSARQVTGTFTTGAVVLDDDTVQFWGIGGAANAWGPYSSNVKRVEHTSDDQWIIMYKDGSLKYNDGQSSDWVDVTGTAEQVSGGRDYFAILMTDGEIAYVGNRTYGQDSTPENLGPVRQIFAGEQHTVALLQTGELEWWGGMEA